MPYANPELRHFNGLFQQANSFNVPDGALEIARNVVITSDDVIEKVRGFYQYLDPSPDTINQTFQYQKTVLLAMTNKIVYLTETGTDPNFVGVKNALTGINFTITAPRRSRSVESNKNFYFTTDQGVGKLEAFNGAVQRSGIPPGLDIRGRFLAENGVLDGASQVGYRAVFGRQDSNSNLLLGAPGEIFIFNNQGFTLKPYTSTGAGPYTITVDNSPDLHNLVTGMIADVSNATVSAANGSFAVTVTTPTQFTYVTSVNPMSGTLSWSATRSARIEVTIPRELTANAGYFVQIYRTKPASGTPQPQFYLVTQHTLTAAEITAGVMVFDDDVEDFLLSAGLYTNPNSAEGPRATNDRAPMCNDIGVFKNFMLFANCQLRQTINLDIVDTSQLNYGDYVDIMVGATTRRYRARAGVGNQTVAAISVAGAGNITITYTAHGGILGDTVYISSVVGTLPAGFYVISNVTANTFDINAPSFTASALDFSFVFNLGGDYLWFLDLINVSVGVQLRNSAQGLVRAINRDPTDLIYAIYVSLPDGVPGEMRLDGQGFDGAINLRASSTQAGTAFSPILPTSFGTVFSSGDQQPSAIYMAKISEPEAVPRLQFILIGSSSKKILRIFALKDSIIVIKEDGVYRVTGDFPDPNILGITLIDSTIIGINDNAASLINNQVAFLSNQGACLVTNAGVQLISRRIEDIIQPIVGTTYAQTLGGSLSYETERLWLLSTVEPQGTSLGTTYIYNVINGSWTTMDQTFQTGFIGPADRLYLVTAGNKLLRERKEFTRLDYSGQNYNVTVTSTSANTAIITSTVAVPEEGDILLEGNVIYRIIAVTALPGNSFQLTFGRAVGLSTGAHILYSGYTSIIEFSPIHGGEVGLSKQFAQFQMHLRYSALTRAVIGFSNNYYGADSETTWSSDTISPTSDGGWGDLPWGLFPWGLEDTINLQYTSREAPIVRVYVPLFTQRGTYLKPKITHKTAGEPMVIQAVTLSVKPYRERTSR